jgi:hypothetical protein
MPNKIKKYFRIVKTQIDLITSSKWIPVKNISSGAYLNVKCMKNLRFLPFYEIHIPNIWKSPS